MAGPDQRSRPVDQSVAAYFLQSPEFQAAGVDVAANGAFVDFLYRNVLGREPDAASRADLVGRLHMLQHDEPNTFVLATGRSFVELSFKQIGVDLAWKGSDVAETGADAAIGRVLVRINPRFYRPAEVELLIGDAGKARDKLGRESSTSRDYLRAIMGAKDLGRNTRGASL